ncbi:MAG: BamA/TamA family outer membrane protein [Candidatus Rokubacteria bacterium]|nr:BamA/TamA family outer membrane protein [Candidatus Rokubacteria bacterium]
MSGPHLIIAVVMVLSATCAAGAQQAPPPKHDPLKGMDPSGRIPKVPLPADLPHPERWRYIPEGRIKPGNVFERFLVSSFAAPQFFFEQDVGVGGGIALTDIDFRSQRRREFLGAFFTHTTEGQQKYRLIWRRWLLHRDLPEGGVIVEERNHVHGFGGYEKSLTRRFYGLGPNTRERDETSYIDEVIDLGARSDFTIGEIAGNWIATVGAKGEHHDLAPGRVSDRPTTNEVFPTLFRAGNHHDSLTVTIGLRYDTRDSQHQPYSGVQLGVVADSPVWQTGGDAGTVGTAYGNVAFRVPPLFHRGGDRAEENRPTDTVALAAFVQTSAGDLPYYERPTLGGSDTLRGFIQHRFTGDAAWHATAEHRVTVVPRGFKLTDMIRIERVGLTAFFDVGTVADDVGRLADARVHTSYGVGLRFSLERTAMFRADMGFSNEGVNFTVGFGLPF